jgi:hypothetical protein
MAASLAFSQSSRDWVHWAFQHYSKIEKTIAPKAASQAQTQVIAAGGAAPQTRDMSIRYVHREGFVLRETESASEKN